MSHQNKNREASARGDQLQSAFAIQSIHDSCSIYLSDCERDHQSQLHEYVRQVDPDAQPMLLRNLLHLELQRRRSLGETPDSRQFVETMPEHASVIRGVFAESAFLVLSDPQRTHTRDGSDSKPNLIQTPASMLLGHYRLIRELGRGGMGLVFEAQHLQRG